jgi:PAS domain S-box-containing protein
MMFNIRSRMGIRKGVFLLLLIVFIPLFLIQAFTYYKWFNMREETEMQSNLELARTVGKTFESFIHDVLSNEIIIGLAATVPPVPSKHDLRGILAHVVKEREAFRDYAWVSPDGKILVSSNPASDNADISRRDYYSRIVAGEKWVVSDIITSNQTGKPIFTISRGIRDSRGNLLGIVVAAILPEKLDHALSVERSKGAGISLIDSKGMHVYRYPTTQYTAEQLNWLKRYPVIKEVLRGEEATVDVTGSRGEKRLGAFTPIPSLGWVAGASRDKGEVMRGIVTTLLPQAIVMLVVTLAAFGGALVFARRISTPIVRLRNHALAVGRGEMEKVAYDSGPGELKELADGFNDMSEKVRIREEALRESEAKALSRLSEIEAYYATAPIGLCVFDTNLRYLRINQRLAETNGIPIADHVGRTVLEVAPALCELAERISRQIIDSGEAVRNIEFSGETAAQPGVPRLWREDWYPIKDSNGTVVAINVAVEDITERKQAEEALKRALTAAEEGRNTLAALMDHIPMGITIADAPNVSIRMISKQGQRIMDRAESEIGQIPLPLHPSRWGVYHADGVTPGAAPDLPLTRATLKGEIVMNEEWIVTRKDGTLVPILCNAAPVRDAEGNVVGGVIGWQDITERKQIEEELRRSRDELELRVQERTSELAEAYRKLQEEVEERERVEEQLRQSHKLEAIGTLAGGIAHDFNNMLAVILGNAELALEDVDEEGPRRNLRQILKASKRSRDLVKQILAFSRRDAGQGKAVKIAPLLRETHELLRASLPSTIHMELNIRTRSDTVFANLSEMQQVIVNLASNAAYAMREAGGTLTIGLSSITLGPDSLPEGQMRKGRYVKLTVKDTGTGITPDVQKRMFEPFFTTKDKGQGTGMGLSVAYGIVKGCHGMIEVESEVGKGSKFTVLLPQTDAVPSIEEREEAPPCSQGAHILFVDDEPAVMEMTKTMLERIGCRVTASTNASEALKVFTANPHSFDLLITDQTMPDMTGVALAKNILAARKDMPVIICTGYSETVSPGKAEEAGIREFVMKPLAKRELADAIRRALDGEKNGE